MTRKYADKPVVESFKIGSYVELDSQLWFVIDSRKGEISRDDFIAKILAHALGLSHSGFGDKS